LTLARGELESLYRREEDPRVKERLLLVVRVEGHRQVPAHVARELYRSGPWTSYWLERYREEGVEGLRDKPREGRPPKRPVEVQEEIKRECCTRGSRAGRQSRSPSL
jgi:putative transposase